MNNTFIPASVEMAVKPVLKKTDTREPAEALSLAELAIGEALTKAEVSATRGLAYAERSKAPVLAYAESTVQPALADHVVCTWVDPPREQRHPVLPDACIDLVWDGGTLFVVGPDTHAAAITSPATFVGICFRPGAAPGFLGVGARELLDQTIPLSELWGRSAEILAEQLAEDPPAAASMLERALLKQQDALWPVDSLVSQAIREIRRSSCEPEQIHLLARRLGVNERTLRRRCSDALGYGPKTLDRILRFRRALRLIWSHVRLADAARQAGHADQSYLTNECRPGQCHPGRARLWPFKISGNGCN